MPKEPPHREPSKGKLLRMFPRGANKKEQITRLPDEEKRITDLDSIRVKVDLDERQYTSIIERMPEEVEFGSIKITNWAGWLDQFFNNCSQTFFQRNAAHIAKTIEFIIAYLRKNTPLIDSLREHMMRARELSK